MRHDELPQGGGAAAFDAARRDETDPGARSAVRRALFTYDSRKLRKTAQGETLEIYAISQRYQDEELRRALKRQEKTSLRIGATKSIGDYILLPQIIRFLKEPDNELFFTVDNTAHLLAQLEGGELDFVVLEGIFDKSRYESFLLRNEPYIGICAKDHPFSGCEVPMDELFSERLILREPGSGTRKILERELMQCGYTVEAFRANVCISSFKLIRHLVSEGCGVSFLYEAVVKNDAQFGHFSCPPLTGVHELNVVCLKTPMCPRLRGGSLTCKFGQFCRSAQKCRELSDMTAVYGISQWKNPTFFCKIELG